MIYLLLVVHLVSWTVAAFLSVRTLCVSYVQHLAVIQSARNLVINEKQVI